jgi:hypothetical protein
LNTTAPIVNSAWLTEAVQRIRDQNRRVMDEMADHWLEPVDDSTDLGERVQHH